MLTDIPLKSVYRSENDNILEEFYVPALMESIGYDRAVGYFSAAMLSYAAQGLTAFINNSGKMRLIIGAELTFEEVQAITDGYDQKKLISTLGDRFLETLENIDDALFDHRLQALSWLVASGQLDVRVAIRKQGMYHEKIGIFYDASNNMVVFQGSANETVNALLPDFNFESINVFPGWRNELTDHFQPYVEGFERLWGGTAKNTLTIDFPDAVKEHLIEFSKRTGPPSLKRELHLLKYFTSNVDDAETSENYLPQIPETLGGKPFEILDHQRETLNAWKQNGFRGVFALATGSGKTITSIYGMVTLAQKAHEKKQSILAIVAVPYVNLADQWIEVLSLFSIHAIKCYGGESSWKSRLSDAVFSVASKATPFSCAVVVNRTLSKETFSSMLAPLSDEQLFWIGDECHHHYSVAISNKLPKNARYRIGLSATPEHYLDQEATDRLTDYYGEIVYEYSLSNALKDRVLTPYYYYIHMIELTLEETDKYVELSKKIAALSAWAAKPTSNGNNEEYFKLLMRRARLLGSAANKIPALDNVLKKNNPSPHTLFYCGDGRVEDEISGEEKRQIELVSELLHANKWRSSRFTSHETPSDRREILDNFRLGTLDAMVAIRCLDEGIDIPACKTAYILASSRNPRQFIQRRGRILRRAKNKNSSTIHDFVVRLPEFQDEGLFAVEKKLFKSELSRIAEFSKLSMNPGETFTELQELLNRFDLEHLL